ncbi:hypothetical protein RKD29_007605 [Streptomyces tendae]
MSDHTYDVIVTGAGPVGENVADRVVQGGLSAPIARTVPGWLAVIGGVAASEKATAFASLVPRPLLRDGKTRGRQGARSHPGELLGCVTDSAQWSTTSPCRTS